jgi:serine/threonine protein kinase
MCPQCELQGAIDLLSAPIAGAAGGAEIGAWAEMASLPRQQFGDYELLEEIAWGGMGVVYRARQHSLDCIVAVKMLLSGPLASREFIQRFRTEAAAAASLQYPNIVAIHEVGFHAGQHFFAMDFIAGRTLAEAIGQQPLPAKRAAAILQTVAEAVHYAHEHGILHRDLKPSNVILDAEDQPHITDFGLAKRMSGDTEATLSAQTLGSPNYMPPEQAATDRARISRRSDVYALGAMLYHTLTGRPPFVGGTLAETSSAVLNTEPVRPRLLNPAVPADLETICLKFLEKESTRRYRTARELADELGRWWRGEPVHARPISRAEKVWRW